MERSRAAVAVVLALGLFVAFATCACATDAQELLQTGAWDLAYDVTFAGALDTTMTSDRGTWKISSTINWGFTAKVLMGIRSEGPSISMTRLATQHADDMASEDVQAAMMAMMSQYGTLANWMYMGPSIDENTPEDKQIEAMLKAREAGKMPGFIDFKRVAKGTGLVTEMGTPYSQETHTTKKGTGKVACAYPLLLELNSETSTYLLTLAHTCVDDSTNTVTEEETTISRFEGEEPSESHVTRQHGINGFPGRIEIDDPKALLGDIPLMEGSIDPSAGVIKGEHVIPAHCSGYDGEVHGTLTFRFTLTPRP